MAMLESKMEELLIEQLTCGVSQWTYRPELTTEEALWNNLREKLNRNNIDKLQGVPITDAEMGQIKQFLLDTAATTYKAARWLSGEHQVAQIPLLREDASLGQVSLMAVNSREVAGGNSSYEVINQYQAVKSDSSDRNRRFDVTLLINGLPMIHIELKNADHPYMDAFRQIGKYCTEGKFRGLMGLVQMFVVSNGSQTRYIAADNHGNMNEKFLTRWVDENNEPVEDYLAFARAALNIPAAHLMVGKYSVLDNERKKLILLRPYQIHAIESIRKASRERESGFVWHTTGSGKTLTSYTVTKNLLDIPSVDKAIFLIDRKDLDQQTTASFLSYADSDDVDVRNTDDTGDLERKLSNKDRCAIITTIQKLQHIIRRCTDSKANARQQKLKSTISAKNIAFVVDECHRAVTPETKRDLDTFFHRSLWYGFTGTPIFEENKREQKGNLPRTTAGMYGLPKDPSKKCLHAYTIKEAIGDGAVLGFRIQGLGFNRSTLEDIAEKLQLDMERIDEMEDKELEQYVVREYGNKTQKNIYDDNRHREDVVDYIVNRCAAKLNLNAPSGEAYEGLLTVSSIQEAQLYYKLFKDFVAQGKVSENIRRLLPDFPKIAITYTVGENEDGATANQDEMRESLADYNAMFGTTWDLSTLGAYNTDLNDRLARKKSKYRDRDQQLDLVIVVDRLLTGFDAPCLSTIFLDRPPMKPQHLIQAFSRTNRIFSKKKRFGNIVTLQMPQLYEQKINEALTLYCDGGVSDVQAPSWAETSAKLKKAIADFKEIAPTSQKALEIHQNGSVDELKAFAKAYQSVDRYIGEAQVYDEYREDKLKVEFGMSVDDFNAFLGIYKNILERIKEVIGPIDKPQPVEVDLEYELESVNKMEINYRYLVTLIQAHMPEGQEVSKFISNSEDQRITKFIMDYKKSNQKVGEVLEQIWFELKLNPESYRDKDAFAVVEERVQELLDKEIQGFAAKWGVNSEALKAFANAMPSSEITSKAVDTSMGDYQAFKTAGGTMPKLKYLRELREAVASFVKDEIKPLTRR